MDQLLLVEYRWSDMPPYQWKFMFVATSMEAVRAMLAGYVFMSSDWSAMWGDGYETYSRRRLDSGGGYQTVRICKTTLVTSEKETA